MKTPKKIVIIGNGVAGMTAANEIRRLDRKAEITIISAESEHFFSRTALMYEYCGQMNMAGLEPFERNHYQKMNFKRVFGRVSGVDVATKTLRLSGDDTLPFDQLLIACGSTSREFPWQTHEGTKLKNVGHFVTLEDLQWLKDVSRNCVNKDQTVAVIGGGLIGIEVAEILAAEPGIKEVHFLVRSKWFWPIALNKAESKFVTENMAKHSGVTVHYDTEVKSITADGDQLQSLILSNGATIPVNFAVATIGVIPVTEFLADSGIELTPLPSAAVIVDAYQQTNLPDIYAAGDCAGVPWLDGKSIRPEQLWYTGRDQGLIAAKNICGIKTEYDRGILYNSAKLFDLEYTTAGLVNFPPSITGEGVSEWYQDNPKSKCTQRIVLKDGRIIGFNALGSRWDHSIICTWIEEKRDLEFVLENLREAQFDAEFSPKFKVTADAVHYAL